MVDSRKNSAPQATPGRSLLLANRPETVIHANPSKSNLILHYMILLIQLSSDPSPSSTRKAAAILRSSPSHVTLPDDGRSETGTLREHWGRS